MTRTRLLERIERYYDAVPRAAARVETLGPFELFVKVGAGWPYYARPRLGAQDFSAADVARVRDRQRELGAPESFEWVAETTPRLASAVEAGGLPIRTHPLMVLDAFKAPTSEAEAEVRLVSPTDDLARFGAVAGLAFQSPGTAVGQVGKDELERAAQRRSQASLNFERQRLEQGLTVSAVALVDGTPVAMGSHQPVDSVCEIVGVGTFPAYRRRGLAGALTALLVKDALQRGLTTIFLSAGDSDVERVYERLGFRRIATACIAEAEGSGAVE